MVKDLPANAGDKGSIPDLEGPHKPQGSGAREPQVLSNVHWSPNAAAREATSAGSPHITRE